MPTELYQEPTATERALEGEIDALLRVHIIMVRKLEDARLERDVANSSVKHLVATVRERDMELKDARQALDNAIKTNQLLDTLIQQAGGYSALEARAAIAKDGGDVV